MQDGVSLIISKPVICATHISYSIMLYESQSNCDSSMSENYNHIFDCPLHLSGSTSILTSLFKSNVTKFNPTRISTKKSLKSDPQITNPHQILLQEEIHLTPNVKISNPFSHSTILWESKSTMIPHWMRILIEPWLFLLINLNFYFSFQI